MEVDLVNAFVEKQRELINDLTGKNIMLEARLAVTEKKSQQVIELQTNVDDLQIKLKSLDQQNSVMNQVIEKANQKENEHKEKIDQLQKLVNKLTLEKEAQRQQAEKLKKKAEEMMADNG